MEISVGHPANKTIKVREKDAPWMTSEIKLIILDKAKIYKQYVKNGRTEADSQRLNEIRARCRSLIKDRKTEYLNDPNKSEPLDTSQTFTEMYDSLLGQGVSPQIAAKLDGIHQKNLIKEEELDDRAVEALKEFSNEDAEKILDQFVKSDVTHVSNKSAFLCGVMKTYKAKLKTNLIAPAKPAEVSITPDIKPLQTTTEASSASSAREEKVKALLDRTGYTLDITTGQRKYGGPPPAWEGPEPGRGEKKFCSQVFLGKLPRDMFEDEIVPVLEEFGVLYDLRIMMDHVSGSNKGYAFCTYTTKQEAQAAVKGLEKKEVRPGKVLGVCLSQSNNRLFVGSIPKSKTKKQIFDEFETKVECLNDVIVYSSAEDKAKNRGFAFLEFHTHKDASTARRKLASGKIKVFGNIQPTVDWADPVYEPDEEVMGKVKVVYVRNLSPAIDETKLNELFKQYGSIEKVKKIKDYAFIHFAVREDAVRAIEELDNQELDDMKIEVSLAKPQLDKKEQRRGMSGFGALNKSNAPQRGGRGAPRGGRGFGQGFMQRGRGGGPGQSSRGGGYNSGYGGYGAGADDRYADYAYGSSYDDTYYDDYYAAAPPPSRVGMRGGPRGMPMRGRPQGMMSMRGRGAPGGMGGRGQPRGRGAYGGRGAPKRKADYPGAQGGKRLAGGDNWSSKPIPQQPLSKNSFYSDDYWN